MAYADDIALLVSGNTRDEVIRKTESALDIITAWATHRGLNFSKEKSVMVPLKGGLFPGFTASFDGGRIKSVPKTKYLGLHLTEDFTFHKHIAQLLDSSADVFPRLKSVRRSKWGVSSALSLFYTGRSISRGYYMLQIFGTRASSALEQREKMESAQRRVLHAITSAYNTVSTRALQILEGTPPIQLHIEMAIRVHNGMKRSESEEILIERWQALWDTSTKGRWTHNFFPDIRSRLNTPISFDHYTAQIVTGHGDFNGKLNHFNLVDTPECSCEYTYEAAEHMLTACPNYDDIRSKLQNSLHSCGIE